MNLVIARSEGVMAIDNQPLVIDTSPLAANIEMVAYDCSSGSGQLEYSNALRVLDPFIDVTPYAPFANTWLTAAAALVGMPVTLAQARAVKVGLIEGIFNSKRQLPISYNGQTWDASDQAIVGMQATINSWDVAAAITSGDAALASSANGINLGVTLHTPASQPAVAGGGTNTIFIMDSISPKSGNGINPVWSLHAITSPSWLLSASGGGVNVQPGYSGSKTNMTYQQTTGPQVSWPPFNSTTSVAMPMTTMRGLLTAIQSRRADLQSTRLTKTSAVNSRSTIPAVIAYDATVGWPS